MISEHFKPYTKLLRDFIKISEYTEQAIINECGATDLPTDLTWLKYKNIGTLLNLTLDKTVLVMEAFREISDKDKIETRYNEADIMDCFRGITYFHSKIASVVIEIKKTEDSTSLSVEKLRAAATEATKAITETINKINNYIEGL